MDIAPFSVEGDASNKLITPVLLFRRFYKPLWQKKNDVPYIKPEVKSCRRSGDMHLNGLEMLFSTHRRHRICTFIRRLFLILFSHAVLHSQLVTQCWYRLQHLALFRAGISKHVVCVPHAAIKGSVWGSQRLKPFCL